MGEVVWLIGGEEKDGMKNVTLGDGRTDTHVNIELDFCAHN